MEINFRAENGLSPYYIYKENKFFIQDAKGYNGNYTYSLYFKSLKVDIKEFTSDKEAFNHIHSKINIRKICHHNSKTLYSNTLSEYILDGHKVTTRSTSRPLSDSFEKYADCLEFAKKQVAIFIKIQEPEQLSFEMM